MRTVDERTSKKQKTKLSSPFICVGIARSLEKQQYKIATSLIKEKQRSANLLYNRTRL